MATIDDVYTLLQSVNSKVDTMQSDLTSIKTQQEIDSPILADIKTTVDYAQTLVISLRSDIEHNTGLTSNTDSKSSTILFELRKRR